MRMPLCDAGPARGLPFCNHSAHRSCFFLSHDGQKRGVWSGQTGFAFRAAADGRITSVAGVAGDVR
jgi:hypothetical protein